MPRAQKDPVATKGMQELDSLATGEKMAYPGEFYFNFNGFLFDRSRATKQITFYPVLSSLDHVLSKIFHLFYCIWEGSLYS